MAENSAIEWTDHTFNPWIGCSKVSPGCDHCYAERQMDTRMHKVRWGAGQPRVRTSEAYWREPLRWNAKAEREGRRFKVFCASLADVFDNEIDTAWRVDLFRLIDSTPHLDWMLLTKRISNAATMIRDALDDSMLAVSRWPWPNVLLGATVCNQEEADRDIPKLLAVPAHVRFLSIEPLLGPVDLTRIDLDGHSEVYPLTGTTGCEDDDGNPAADLPALDWVIVGGESGPGARPCDVSWIRSIVQQCRDASVPAFVKQLGAQPRGWCAAIPAGGEPESQHEPDYCNLYEAHEFLAPCPRRCAMLCHPKVAAPVEWPADLRVRKVPA